MRERWRPVPHYGGLYEVSDAGRVRSLPHRVPCARGSRISPGRILKTDFPGVKYRHVTLFKNGVPATRTVHRLVLLAFVGPTPKGKETCHRNGDCHDNRLSNLRYDTSLANHADSIRLGVTPRGERRAQAKIRERDVIEIRKARDLGITAATLSKRFGISEGQIWKIHRRKKWKHVE